MNDEVLQRSRKIIKNKSERVKMAVGKDLRLKHILAHACRFGYHTTLRLTRFIN